MSIPRTIRASRSVDLRPACLARTWVVDSVKPGHFVWRPALACRLRACRHRSRREICGGTADGAAKWDSGVVDRNNAQAIGNSITHARQQAQDARAKLQQNIDPIDARCGDRQAQKESPQAARTGSVRPEAVICYDPLAERSNLASNNCLDTPPRGRAVPHADRRTIGRRRSDRGRRYERWR